MQVRRQGSINQETRENVDGLKRELDASEADCVVATLAREDKPPLALPASNLQPSSSTFPVSEGLSVFFFLGKGDPKRFLQGEHAPVGECLRR